MPFIPERTIDEIRARTDLVELIGAHVRLKRAGQNFLGRCPFHQEKTPSFNVSPSRQRYHCFGCDEDGDCFTFMMQHQGMTFTDAVHYLAERVGVTIEHQEDDGRTRTRKELQRIHAELADFFGRCLMKMKSAETARTYLKQRDLEAAIEPFKIGYAPNRWDVMEHWARKNNCRPDLLEQAGLVKRSPRARSASGVYDRFRDRLMFPINDVQGRPVAFSGRVLQKDDQAAKYVNSPETDIFRKSRILYGLDKARRHIVGAPNREAVICEGQIDVIRCHMNGIETAVAAQGTAFTPEHVDLLRRYADTVVLVFDSDAAGLKAAIRTARLFLTAGVPARIAGLPAGEDPDSILSANGNDVFRDMLQHAVSPVQFEINTLRAHEPNPDSVDALARMASSVVETLADCSNAILRARLVQEASDTLKLPEAALKEELAKLEQKRAEQQARRDGHATPTPAPDVLEEALPTPKTNASGKVPGSNEREDQNLEPLEDWASDPEGIVDLLPEELIGSTDNPPPDVPLSLSPSENLLCEYLVQWIDCHDLMRFIIEHVPVEILKHPDAQSIIGAVVETIHEGGSGLEHLRRTAAVPLQKLIRELETTPPKSIGAEYTAEDAVHDAVLGVWRDYLTRERTRLSRSDSEDLLRRQQISIALRHMRAWSSGEQIIDAELGLMRETEFKQKKASV